MEKTLDVLAVGNAIVDVFSSCDDGFLDQQSIGKGMMNLVDAERSAALYANRDMSACSPHAISMRITLPLPCSLLVHKYDTVTR